MEKILVGLTLVGLLLLLSGYKKVNSVSYIKEWNDKVKAETSEIEDYFDLNGEYIKTTVTYSHGEHRKLHNTMHGEKKPMELYEPTTIMLPDDFTQNFTKILTEQEKDQLKKHVFEYVEGGGL